MDNWLNQCQAFDFKGNCLREFLCVDNFTYPQRFAQNSKPVREFLCVTQPLQKSFFCALASLGTCVAEGNKIKPLLSLLSSTLSPG